MLPFLRYHEIYFYVFNIRKQKNIKIGLDSRIVADFPACCWVMTNGDPKGLIFVSHPHTNNGLFFLHTIKYRILCLTKRLPEVPEYDEMRHDTMTSF